jgi:hypothetical protein
VALHRFSPEGPEQQPNQDTVQFFGGTPALWFGAGQRALWISLGADDALPALKDTMDRVAASPPAPDGWVSPLTVVFHRAPWLVLPVNEDSPGAVSMREISQESFTPQTDAIWIESQPLENGVRTRIELDEGYLRWLALVIARRFDRSQL